MLSLQLILELTYWTPLIALVLSSLGLIALKRISGLPLWAERLAAPPFYFVSLPIATLIMGMEMFVWMVHVVKKIDSFSASYGLLDHVLFLLGVLRFYLFVPIKALIAGIFSAVLLTAQVMSVYVLWRTLLRENRGKDPASRARHRLKAVVLFSCFVLAWLSMKYLIVHLPTMEPL